MNDQINRDKDMANYELQEDGGIGFSEPPATPRAKLKFSNTWIRKIAIPLGIVALIIIVYMFLSWSSTKKTKAAETSPDTNIPKSEVVTAPTPALVIAQPPVAPSVPAISKEQIAQMVSDQVQQMQDNLQRKIDDVSQQVSSSQQQLSALTNNISQNKQDINSINQNLATVVSSLSEVNKSVQTLTAPKKKPKKVVRKEVPPKPYHVKAVVPGRVWLESADGKVVSLRVGDYLAGYGTIELISPRQGMVITSTGAIIQYGVNDI